MGHMQDAVNLMLHKRTFLHLEDDTARLQAFHIVPGVLGDVHSDTAFRQAQHDTFDDRARIIIRIDTHAATQQDEALVFRHMVMDGDLRTHLKCVQKAVALIIEALMEIVVHTQSGRLSGLPDYAFNQFIVYYLHTFSEFNGITVPCRLQA